MAKWTRSTRNAIANYGMATCVAAYRLNAQCGEGAASIANSYPLPLRTTRQADAAINAGAEIMRAARAALELLDGVL